jgi:hypothetical protein
VGWDVWKKWIGLFFFVFFFVIWWFNEDFFSIKYIIKKIFLWGMENFQHKNLTKRTKHILFKIEHLIHLTERGEIYFFWLLCVSKFFYVHDKKVDVLQIIIIFVVKFILVSSCFVFLNNGYCSSEGS